METAQVPELPRNSPSPVTCELVPVAGMNLQALRNSGKGWLVIKHVCKLFGLNDRSQRRRIESSAWSVGAVMALTVTARKLITEHVNRYAAAMNMSQHETWRFLYYHVNRRLSISVYSYKLGPKETKLDRLQSLGLLDKVGKVSRPPLHVLRRGSR